MMVYESVVFERLNELSYCTKKSRYLRLQLLLVKRCQVYIVIAKSEVQWRLLFRTMVCTEHIH
jgi:hypothetical protein